MSLFFSKVHKECFCLLLGFTFNLLSDIKLYILNNFCNCSCVNNKYVFPSLSNWSTKI